MTCFLLTDSPRWWKVAYLPATRHHGRRLYFCRVTPHLAHGMPFTTSCHHVFTNGVQTDQILHLRDFGSKTELILSALP